MMNFFHICARGNTLRSRQASFRRFDGRGAVAGRNTRLDSQ